MYMTYHLLDTIKVCSVHRTYSLLGIILRTNQLRVSHRYCKPIGLIFCYLMTGRLVDKLVYSVYCLFPVALLTTLALLNF